MTALYKFQKVLFVLTINLFPFLFFGQDCLSSENADSLLAFSKKFLGTPYRYASMNPQKGFDCSGFTSYVFNHFGYKVPRSSLEYEKFGKSINKDSAKAGDIIVFRGTNAKNKRPGHVGIVIERTENDLVFIHSSSNKKRGGVIISTFNQSPYYLKRFIRICRITNCN